jgi:uncharacterized protein
MSVYAPALLDDNPPPPGPWIMEQTWRSLLFAHWPVDADALRPHIPPGVTLDTFKGQAWLGVTPFHLTGLRVRGLPPVPGTSAFYEINVRTYVVGGGLPGIAFLSLDADNLFDVLAARALYHLPYFHARMAFAFHAGRIHYAGRRAHPGGGPGRFTALYRPVSPVYEAAPGTLAHWLTARYRLFTTGPGGRLHRGEIRHAPWPLQDAAGRLDARALVAADGAPPPTGAPLLHYVRRLKTRFWPLVAVESGAG